MIYLTTRDYGVYSSRVAWDVGAFFVSFSFTTTEKIWAFKNLVFSSGNGWSYCLFGLLFFLSLFQPGTCNSVSFCADTVSATYTMDVLVGLKVVYTWDREKSGEYKGTGWESGK